MANDIEIKERAARLKGYREAARFGSAAEAARYFRWVESTYRSHENGTRPIRDEDADRYAAGFRKRGLHVQAQDILYGLPHSASDTGTGTTKRVAIMGRVGAGAVVEPEFEQVPPDGLDDIDLIIPVPEGLIGFEVIGDSMTPRYDEGDVILVWRNQQRALESFYGEEAVVRTSAGHRYLKTIQHGHAAGVVTLYSFNAKPIQNVRLEWIGEVYSTIRGSQVHRIQRAKARKRVAIPAK